MFQVTSKFIETPCKRVARFKFDLTTGEKITIPFEGIAGAEVRIEVAVYQDESETVSRETITENLKRWGATGVDIRISRIPRETVRAVEVLDAPTLRLKIVEQTKIKGEEVDPGILELADRLEGTPVEVLLQQARGGAA